MTAEALADIALRPVGPGDVAVASAVHQGCFDEYWHDRAMADILNMPGSFGFFAMVGDQPAGLAIALAAGTDGEILTLGVLPEYRRRGVAGDLLAGIASAMAERGCRRILLEVAADNHGAHALYRRAGFTEAGRRPGYYRRGSGSPVDAVLLARIIAADGPEMPAAGDDG